MFTAVLTCIWWVHQEHRFSCWNHPFCISCRNFISRLRIMIWLFWCVLANMRDQMLGSHLICQNVLCETWLTVRCKMMYDRRHSSQGRRCDGDEWNRVRLKPKLWRTCQKSRIADTNHVKSQNWLVSHGLNPLEQIQEMVEQDLSHHSSAPN